MPPEFISIIGCGNLGSALAYMIMLRTMEKDLGIQQLCLIDNDTLEPKNLPYLYSNKKEYIFRPKVFILKDILLNISNKIDIKTIYSTYPNLSNIPKENIKEVYNTFIIDCRDTSSEHSLCSIKLNLDGPFGVINLNPRDIPGTHNSRYTINNSRYYAMLFAGICCQIIFKDIDLKDNKSLIDLRKGELHGILSKEKQTSDGL